MRRALLSALLAVTAPLLFATATPAFAAGTPHGSRSTSLHGTVNLNQADEAQLELLPGVGPAKAARIIAWRHAHPFHKVAELTRVRGFGRKTLVRLQSFLSVSGPSTLALDKPAPTSAARNTEAPRP